MGRLTERPICAYPHQRPSPALFRVGPTPASSHVLACSIHVAVAIQQVTFAARPGGNYEDNLPSSVAAVPVMFLVPEVPPQGRRWTRYREGAGR